MQNFEEKLNKLEISVFDKIASQTTEDDKKSLLAIQNAVREIRPNYTYLEIGSHLGGSMQPHLIDDKCSKIYSIDKRPLVQPDERGVNYGYPENSTKRMLDLLSGIGSTEKIYTIDGETKSINKSEIKEKAQLCFIDGEHTDKATIIDFDFCLDVLDNSGAIIFHDSFVIYNAIWECMEKLKAKNIKFQAYNLPSVVFVLEINDFPLHKSSHIQNLLLENNKGYLFSLRQNDQYRRFTTSFPMSYIWKLFIKLGIKF
jgi:hypothetical protein